MAGTAVPASFEIAGWPRCAARHGRRAIAVMTVAAGWLLLHLAAGAEEGAIMTHELPTDPDAVVIAWRSAGGLGAQDDDGPDLVVRADGAVTVAGRFSGRQPERRSISQGQLQGLLAMALDNNRFFTIDEGEVERRIAAVRARWRAAPAPGEAITVPAGPPYVDAGTTTIAIAADGRRHEVSVHGLFAAARDFPEIEELQRLRAIELALLELAQETPGAAPR